MCPGQSQREAWRENFKISKVVLIFNLLVNMIYQLDIVIVFNFLIIVFNLGFSDGVQ